MLVAEFGAKKSCGSYQNIQNREKKQHAHLSDTATLFSSEVTIICLQSVQVIEVNLKKVKALHSIPDEIH